MTTRKQKSGTFTTSSGKVLKLKKMNPWLIDEVYKAHRLPPVPTYTVTTATGATEEHPHDETTLDTPEAQMEYAEWQKVCAELTEKQEERLQALLFLRGLDVDLPKDEDWAEEQEELLGIVVPVKKAQRKLHFIKTEVIEGLDDLLTLMESIMTYAGVSEVAIEVAKSSFQRAVEEANPVAGTASEKGQVEL